MLLSFRQKIARDRLSAGSLAEGELILSKFECVLKIPPLHDDDVSPGADLAAAYLRPFPGNVHVCSKSVVFEPRDQFLALCRFSFSTAWMVSRGSLQQDGASCDVQLSTNEVTEICHMQAARRHRHLTDFAVTLQLSVQDADHFVTLANRAASVEASLPHPWQVRHPPLLDLIMDCADKTIIGQSASIEYRIRAVVTEAVALIEEDGKSLVVKPVNTFCNEGNDVIPFDQIRRIQSRQWRLDDCALEVYWQTGEISGRNITAGQESNLEDCTSPGGVRANEEYIPPHRFTGWTSTFLYFDNAHSRDSWKRRIYERCENLERSTLESAQKSWVFREWTNLEYLLFLNMISGRSKHDLSQYPIMPWCRTDFGPNLGGPRSRDLSKPIGALNPVLLEKARNRLVELDLHGGERWLYGSHYSTPLYVLYYLVRLRPDFMLRFTGGTFDIPDRLFFSVAETWRGVFNNPTDQKELIPEFYDSDGSFLLNRYRVDLGTRQDGNVVGDVLLPKWAHSAAHFIAEMNRSLESDQVSSNIHRWIDLVFGLEQRGEQAIRAENLFHPLTYTDLDMLKSEPDNVRRHALRVQAVEFGRMPRQLFFQAHPPRLPSAASLFKMGLHADRAINDSHQQIKQQVRISWIEQCMTMYGLVYDEVRECGEASDNVDACVSSDGLEPMNGAQFADFCLNSISLNTQKCKQEQAQVVPGKMIVLSGYAGSGKSWFVNRVLWELCTKCKQQPESGVQIVPCLVPGKEIVKSSSGWVTSWLADAIGGTEGAFAGMNVLQGNAVLIVDGWSWDMATSRSLSIGWSALLNAVSAGCVVVVTCRTPSNAVPPYIRSLIAPGKDKLDVMDFQMNGLSESMLRELLKSKCQPHVQTSIYMTPLIRDLCRMPLAAAAACKVLNESTDKIWPQKLVTELCEHSLRLLCGGLSSSIPVQGDSTIHQRKLYTLCEAIADFVLRCKPHPDLESFSTAHVDIATRVASGSLKDSTIDGMEVASSNVAPSTGNLVANALAAGARLLPLSPTRLQTDGVSTTSANPEKTGSVHLMDCFGQLVGANSIIVPSGDPAEEGESHSCTEYFRFRHRSLLHWLLVRYRIKLLDDSVSSVWSLPGSTVQLPQAAIQTLLPDGFLLSQTCRPAVKLLVAAVSSKTAKALVHYLSTRLDGSGACLELAQACIDARHPSESASLFQLVKANASGVCDCLHWGLSSCSKEVWRSSSVMLKALGMDAQPALLSVISGEDGQEQMRLAALQHMALTENISPSSLMVVAKILCDVSQPEPLRTEAAANVLIHSARQHSLPAHLMDDCIVSTYTAGLYRYHRVMHTLQLGAVRDLLRDFMPRTVASIGLLLVSFDSDMHAIGGDVIAAVSSLVKQAESPLISSVSDSLKSVDYMCLKDDSVAILSACSVALQRLRCEHVVAASTLISLATKVCVASEEELPEMFLKALMPWDGQVDGKSEVILSAQDAAGVVAELSGLLSEGHGEASACSWCRIVRGWWNRALDMHTADYNGDSSYTPDERAKLESFVEGCHMVVTAATRSLGNQAKLITSDEETSNATQLMPSAVLDCMHEIASHQQQGLSPVSVPILCAAKLLLELSLSANSKNCTASSLSESREQREANLSVPYCLSVFLNAAKSSLAAPAGAEGGVTEVLALGDELELALYRTACIGEVSAAAKLVSRAGGSLSILSLLQAVLWDAEVAVAPAGIIESGDALTKASAARMRRSAVRCEALRCIGPLLSGLGDCEDLEHIDTAEHKAEQQQQWETIGNCCQILCAVMEEAAPSVCDHALQATSASDETSTFERFSVDSYAQKETVLSCLKAIQDSNLLVLETQSSERILDRVDMLCRHENIDVRFAALKTLSLHHRKLLEGPDHDEMARCRAKLLRKYVKKRLVVAAIEAVEHEFSQASTDYFCQICSSSDLVLGVVLERARECVRTLSKEAINPLPITKKGLNLEETDLGLSSEETSVTTAWAMAGPAANFAAQSTLNQQPRWIDKNSESTSDARSSVIGQLCSALSVLQSIGQAPLLRFDLLDVAHKVVCASCQPVIQDDSARLAAIKALWKLKVKDRMTIRTLAGAAGGDSSFTVRSTACVALANMNIGLQYCITPMAEILHRLPGSSSLWQSVGNALTNVPATIELLHAINSALTRQELSADIKLAIGCALEDTIASDVEKDLMDLVGSLSGDDDLAQAATGSLCKLIRHKIRTVGELTSVSSSWRLSSDVQARLYAVNGWTRGMVQIAPSQRRLCASLVTQTAAWHGALHWE